MLAIKFILLVLLTLISYTLGFHFTEGKFDLQKYKLFQFKAFECRKCLTFHITWVLNTFVSLLFKDYIMLIVGVVFAIGVFIGLYIDEKNRFNYDE